jgi:hypothetical protein
LVPPFSRPREGAKIVLVIRCWSCVVTFEGRPKKRSSLPPWVWENIPIGVIAAIFIFYVVPVYFLGWFDKPVVVEAGPTAQLVVRLGPRRIYAEESSTRIRALEVRIANQGPVLAQGIQVFGVVRGSKFRLSGPEELPPGGEGTYAGPATVSISSEDAIAIAPECATCSAQSVSPQSSGISHIPQLPGH